MPSTKAEITRAKQYLWHLVLSYSLFGPRLLKGSGLDFVFLDYGTYSMDRTELTFLCQGVYCSLVFVSNCSVT